MAGIDIGYQDVSLTNPVHWSHLNCWLHQWQVSRPVYAGLVHCMYIQWVFLLKLIFAQTGRHGKIPNPSPSEQCRNLINRIFQLPVQPWNSTASHGIGNISFPGMSLVPRSVDSRLFPGNLLLLLVLVYNTDGAPAYTRGWLSPMVN